MNMVLRTLLILELVLLNIVICEPILDIEDEVTKPPKRWVDLPWPVRVDKNSRHASGVIPGEVYIPPTLDNGGLTGRMSPSDVIEHVKQNQDQSTLNKPLKTTGEWDIVPDPNSEGGFKLVESSSSHHRPTVSENGGFQQPSRPVLANGGQHVAVPSQQSVDQWNHEPSDSRIHFPSSSVWAVPSSQQNKGTDLNQEAPSLPPKTGWGVSSAGQSQFHPAAHWHASSNPDVEQTSSLHGIGVVPAYGQYRAPTSIGSTTVNGASFSMNDPSKCPAGATGQFVYRPDCRQFLNCWKGRGFVQFCAPGTLFNPETSECDFPSKVKCLQLSQEEQRWNNVQPVGTVEKHTLRESRMLETTPPPRHLQNIYLATPTVSIPRVRNDCPMVGGTGLTPHSTDCSKFVNCWKGTPHTMSCAPGTLFNPQTLQCDFPYRVNCLVTSVSSQGGSYNERESRLVEQTLSPRNSADTKTQATTPTPRGKTDCPMAGGTGFAPHPTDCSKYINCWKGTAHTQQCGPGTLFSPQTLQCDYAYRVNCVVAAVNTQENAPGKLSPNKPIQPTEPPRYVTYSRTVPTTTRASTTSTTTRPTSTTTRPTSTTTRPTSTTTRPTSTTTRPTRRTTTKTTTVSTTTTTTTTPSPPKPVKNNSFGDNPSGQVLRLRGGSGPWDGYVEVQDHGSWGLVCDEKNSWSIVEATVVCHQLGFERGAELSWQGRPMRPTEDTLRVSVNKVMCAGDEDSFSSCQLESQTSNGKQCVIARDAVGVRCYKNWVSQCHPGEVNHGKKCYNLVVPSVRYALEGFSHGEALRDCQSHGSQLLDITSQKESDFISEWLLQLHPNITNILTAGVGVTVLPSGGGVTMLQRPLWLWEGSMEPFKFTKWWPGWANDIRNPPKTGARPVCIVAKRVFPCEHAYYTSDVIADIDLDPHEHENVRKCAANYFYWDTEECSITHGHPYICERPNDDIGCVDSTKYNYQGTANVTANGLPCINWDDPQIIPKLKYRVSERQRTATLVGHNYCRNVGSDSQPWCFAGKEKTREPCSIPVCWNKEVEKTLIVRGCRTGEFECRTGECIAEKWKCDGEKDCSNGLDEQNCGRFHNLVSRKTNHRLLEHDKEKWLQTDVDTCAQHCQDAKEFICKSFSHQKKDSICLLSDSNVGLSGSLVKQEGWDYYEMKNYSVQCEDKFQCDNGKCVNMSLVCNGKNNCGDRSDEKNCTAEYLDYEIRLTGSNVSHEGRVEVKVYGQWGVICDDMFGLRDAEVVCRELGFSLGATEVLPPGSYVSRDKKEDLVFLVDDLKCLGNESSILECEFEGWGVHDCMPEEFVSVVCRVPGQTCAPGYWQCKSTKDCLPISYLCDNIDDCDDASDEDPARCNLPIEIRLAGGSSNMEGRVEVRYHGIWGTVCDDDFAVPAATVICHSLGFGGPAQAKKDGFFGPGEGEIWIDQLHCAGNETGIGECLHSQWGEHNCHHNEDAGVVCSLGDVRQAVNPHKMNPEPPRSNILPANNILPSECGKRNLDILNKIDDQKARVVGGNEVLKGSYPWQASVRVRTGGKSVHWCGAVIISPLHILTAGHCLQDYTKGAYFIRVGDHDTEEVEESEQELNIDEIYLHEQFNKGIRLNNDIALVKIKGVGIQLGPEVMPACLPRHGIQYTAGLNCTISGWGSMKAAGSGYSRRLRAAWISLLPHETCKATFVYGTKSIGDGMFCAGSLEGGVDSCQGDSGGPIICLVNGEFTLYGITSWGHGCGRANKPGVYSNVGFYRDWIDKKLEDSMSGH